VNGVPVAKQTEYRADVDSKAKKLPALELSPGYQDELTGSLSFQYTEITTAETDGFLAVSVCSNLAFLGSGC